MAARVIARITSEEPYGVDLDDDELEDDRADHQIQPRRHLTRTDRLQRLADAGYDTWAEARGER